jgi:hypothetical protein
MLLKALALLAASGSRSVVLDPTLSVDVKITTEEIATTSANFLGFTYDSFEVRFRDRWLNWSDPLLFALAAPLSGTTLRIGGSLTNHMRFVLNQTAPAKYDNQTEGVPLAKHVRNISKVWLMDISDHFETVWDQIYAFAKKVGFRVLFQLSPCSTRFQNSSWDTTNTRAFLDYIRRHGQDTEGVLVGFEFVNEPFLFNLEKKAFKITPAQLGDDFAAAKALMDDVFGSGSNLILQGPDISTFGTSLGYAEELVSKKVRRFLQKELI